MRRKSYNLPYVFAVSLFVGLVFAIVSTGCATTAEVKTPQEIAKQVCPSVTGVLDVLSVPGTLDSGAMSDLAVVKPVVEKVCSAGIEMPDVKSLADVVPVIVKLVNAAPIHDDDKRAAVISIAVVNAALAPLVQ